MNTEKYFVYVIRTGAVGRLYTDETGISSILERGDTIVIRSNQLASLIGGRVMWIDIAETSLVKLVDIQSEK